MTRMAARAYKMADAIRSAGAKVVFGGPHVTEVPDEPLGRAGEPRTRRCDCFRRSRSYVATYCRGCCSRQAAGSV
jgi:hypothetical protein